MQIVSSRFISFPTTRNFSSLPYNLPHLSSLKLIQLLSKEWYFPTQFIGHTLISPRVALVKAKYTLIGSTTLRSTFSENKMLRFGCNTKGTSSFQCRGSFIIQKPPITSSIAQFMCRNMFMKLPTLNFWFLSCECSWVLAQGNKVFTFPPSSFW